MHVQVELDGFVSWLCLYDGDEVVGYVGTWFDSPLARYLSEVTGHLYGVDGFRYGYALHDERCWLGLPCWAERFSCWIESCSRRPVTGDEVLDVLAQIELLLRPRQMR
jgi:hypothetical protein